MTNHPPRDDQFMGLYAKNARRLHAYIYSLLPHAADADDVFQETSRLLWEKFDEFQPGTDFTAWAYRVAHFQVLYFCRRRERSRLSFSTEFVEAVAGQIRHDGDTLELRHRALAHCLEKLSRPHQELIRLRYREGATTQSVAAQIGRSRDAVYKALNRIQDLLLECSHRFLRRENQA